MCVFPKQKNCYKENFFFFFSKNCQNPFQAIVRLKKEKKKSGMDM